jgi:UDP-N-acetylenolpyruvoylglucosamine reductase
MDIEKLIDYVRKKVFEVKKIMLETEIKFIGDNYVSK